MISQGLLAILRCPACVAGPARRPGEDPGRLELVKDTWLVCQEPGCGHKYPIVDGIPVMLLEKVEQWIGTPVAELPVPPPVL